MFLLIQNHGVAPIEAYTLLGMSTSRGVAGAIGQFGSGTKHAINVLLRNGIEFHIYCGLNKLEFFYKRHTVQDGLGDHETQKVFCRVTGEINRTIDCGWVLEFGGLDWTNVAMALREFVSNAIDRTVKETGGFLDSMKVGDLVVEQSPSKRARAGATRIYVQMCPQVNEFYQQLGHHFLHFSDRPQRVSERYLDTPANNGGPKIYREGVFVRQLQGKASAFDYNFNGKEIKIDESRNSSEYEVRANIGNALNQAPAETLAKLFDLMEKGDLYESQIDSWYLGYHTEEKHKDNWQKAWKQHAGEALVTASVESPINEAAVRKGHAVKVVKSIAFAETLTKMGVTAAVTVVGRLEEGEEVDAPAEFSYGLMKVWHWLDSAGMTQGKEMPIIKAFKAIMNAGGETFGFYRPGEDAIHIREDQGGKYLLKVIFEECVHYITGATDNSRDFQNFLIDFIIEQETSREGALC